MAQKNKLRSFAGIPRVVLMHKDYHRLSGNAVKLLVDLCYQYRGNNNGDLTTAFGALKKRGWKSRATVDRAKRELLSSGLITETRSGRFLNPGGQCALYALSWASIDECPGKRLDVNSTNLPHRTFNDDGVPKKNITNLRSAKS